jgi:predicted aconitase with swiveling domain
MIHQEAYGEIFNCQVYVDNIIFGSTNKDYCKEFGELRSKEFEMSMIEEFTFFLGFQVKQMREGIFISQEKYTKDLLKRFNMDECKPIKTPVPSNGHLDLDEGGKSVDQTLYRSMIGSLLYLTTSRPNIMFSVYMCARFQASTKEAHLVVIKRILRYLKRTPSIGLWYPKGASFQLIEYSNLDYTGCKIDRKRTFGGFHLLGRSLVSWSSKMQNSVALSTIEAEYITAGACCAQIIYMKQTLLDYGVVLEKVPLLCDNESTIKLVNNLVQHSRTRHIDIRHHFLRDHVAKNDISLEGVRTKDQLANILTKPLDKLGFVS